LAFQEAIFCDLNWSVQHWSRFKCYAFRPVAKLRLSSVKSAEDATGDQGSVISGGDETVLRSDRFKYREALAIQRARVDPDGVNVDIKYHLAWNTPRRKPVFVHSVDTRRVIAEAFSVCGDEVGGLASVLWLAPDHIHIYIESDGEKSLEAIAKELKRASALALRGELNSQGLFSGMARRVWDRAYFAETVG
jgi:REP element-mobilizing transposase RayT